LNGANLITGDHNKINVITGADPQAIREAIAEPSPPSLFQVLPPVPDFVGRGREIELVLEALRQNGSACIRGMGGIGKTELARVVADRARELYPGAQLRVDLRGTTSNPCQPEEALAHCLRALRGAAAALPGDRDSLVAAYRQELNGRRALIVLDNAVDSAQITWLLPPRGCGVLVTTRRTVAVPGLSPSPRLSTLSPADSRALLQRICPRLIESVADEISRLCGHLPLALRLAGSLLVVREDLDPGDYVVKLTDERLRLETIGSEGAEQSVDASFRMSYAHLTAEEARVFRQLSVFPASFDARAEEAVCHDNGHISLSSTLVRHSLVQFLPDTRRYSLHDLARVFAANQLGAAEKRAAALRHATHSISLLSY
jgi:hypothetical protein